MIIAAHSLMKSYRKFHEIRPAPAVQKRNISLVVVLLLGSLLQDWQSIKQLNMEKGGKTKSKERKVELPMLQVPINLMLNYLIWAHFVYNAGFSRILQSAKREPEDKIETSDW
nr:OTU domain-containing protein 3 isoform X6 [Ipomoea batatas]GMC60107.1 OTU domain-containing protein 3 isoform X6 [Ipomoea batatas]GMD55269.1 OTU domain-containing protein 3 isoform X6 [Ipomoea batatas]